MQSRKIIHFFQLLSLLFFSNSAVAQIGPDGTGTVNGIFIGPDEDLSNVDLAGANLSNANLTDALLTNSILASANLSQATLDSTFMRNGDLTNADLTSANLIFSDLTNANLTNANFSNTNLANATLSGATLTGVISGGITNAPSSLPTNWQLVSGYLLGPGANLSNADLSNSDLTGVVLSNADLTNANFTGANLTGADLSNTNLEGTVFFGATLEGINATGTYLSFQSSELFSALAAKNLEILNLETALSNLQIELDSRPTIAELEEGRLGSIVLGVNAENQVELSLQLQESDDLTYWVDSDVVVHTTTLGSDKKFYRFSVLRN